MSWRVAIVELIGRMFKHILPIIIKEAKEPDEVTYVPKNDNRNDDIKSHIDRMRAKDRKTPGHSDVDNGE